MTRLAVPDEFRSIKNINSPECNQLIKLYRAALAVENVSEDRCFTPSRSGRVSVSQAYVIAVADGVLTKCKSNMIGSTVSLPNIDELEIYTNSSFPEHDDLAKKIAQGWYKLSIADIENKTKFARRNRLDHLGSWISPYKVDGKYRYNEYNLSLDED